MHGFTEAVAVYLYDGIPQGGVDYSYLPQNLLHPVLTLDVCTLQLLYYKYIVL